jgi:hypothetical protein
MSEPHVCRYAGRLVWSDWTRADGLAERLGRRVPVCAICGSERPARRPRPPELRQVRADKPAAPPLADPAGRAVAGSLLLRACLAEDPAAVPVRGLLGEMARRGLPGSLAEEWIERFLRAGWLAATWRLGGGSPRLAAVEVLALEALREFVAPGAEEQRRLALAAARARVAGLSHPKAREIAALLEEAGARDFPPVLLTALAALAVHTEAGDVLAERVFAARYLGDSKALAALRNRIERGVGPLAEIGIREGAAVTLLGGRGLLRLSGGEVDLAAFAPFLGLAREVLERLEAIAFPPAGLLVVENLTAFEACCRGEVEDAGGCLVVWSGGYPGRAVRCLVERAAAARVPVRVWADLDLDGVRIARLVLSWAGSAAAACRMSPGDLAAAPARRPLSPRAAAAIRSDLEERPGAPLAETLRALLAAGRWVEQEVFL